MSDDKIIDLLKNDPKKGMEQIINEYTGLLYSVCRKYLSPGTFCDADIEDCVSDTFCEAYEGINSFDRTRCSTKSWLCVIAKRRATDTLRAYYKRINTSPIDDTVILQSDAFDTEEDLIERSERQRLVCAIKQLDKTDRQIIVRKFFLCQPSKQIAAEMALTVRNVDTRTSRAIKKLQKIMGE